MRVWIDLATPPHPLLFAPVSRRLEELGHRVLITARDHAETIQLAAGRWSRFDVLGSPSPSGRIRKARAVAARVRALRAWAERHGPDVALSHNSYAQIVAARSSGIPAVTAMDYEYQPANHVAFRLASLILLPEALPEEVARSQGARGVKVWRYPGLKEALYVGDFEPDPGSAEKLGIERGPDDALVVVRTPPSRALYHRLENPLFGQVVATLGDQPRVRGAILPRYPEQRSALQELGLPNFVIPDGAIDARSLMYEADLVIGAGGTMSREAALMGVPTLSLFHGRRPAVDLWLEQNGAMGRLERVDQIAGIGVRNDDPRPVEELRAAGGRILSAFVDATLSFSATR